MNPMPHYTPPVDLTTNLVFQFVLGSGLSSRLIAWWGQGYDGYSHVDAVLENGLMGARSDWIKPLGGGGKIAPGLRLRPFFYESWVRRTVVSLFVGTEAAEAANEWLEKQEGAKYDEGAIWSFITGKRRHQKGRWICSAAQYGRLRAGAVSHASPVRASQVTPNELFFALTAGMGGKILLGA